MINKATDSKNMAVQLHDNNMDLDFSANRYYYSLYQIADHYAKICLEKDIWKELEAERLRRRQERSRAPLSSVHKRMEDVVLTFGKTYKNLFSDLYGLRRTADYYPTPIKKFQLDIHRPQALKLFNMMKVAIEKKELENE